jgi:hypothetical protein
MTRSLEEQVELRLCFYCRARTPAYLSMYFGDDSPFNSAADVSEFRAVAFSSSVASRPGLAVPVHRAELEGNPRGHRLSYVHPHALGSMGMRESRIVKKKKASRPKRASENAGCISFCFSGRACRFCLFRSCAIPILGSPWDYLYRFYERKSTRDREINLKKTGNKTAGSSLLLLWECERESGRGFELSDGRVACFETRAAVSGWRLEG